MEIAIPNKAKLKQQAKQLKGFLTLIKQKLNRQQISRQRNFRMLLALVFDPEANQQDRMSKM